MHGGSGRERDPGLEGKAGDQIQTHPHYMVSVRPAQPTLDSEFVVLV